MTDPLSPKQIQVKACRIYGKAIRAWLSGDESFFPYRLRVNTASPEDVRERIQWNERLQDAEKKDGGFGFRIERTLQNKRGKGKNWYPTAVYLDSLDDVAACASKKKELANLRRIEAKIRRELPALNGWLIENWKQIAAAAEDLESLITVAQFMIDNPRPGCYIRELPIAVSTKLVESNKSILQAWFDILLPPDKIDFTINASFEDLYGFRKQARHFFIRSLDRGLTNTLGLMGDEISLPTSTINSLSVDNTRVWVVENRVTLLALPQIDGSIAFGGTGNDLSWYSEISWLPNCQLFYWGDIDVEGFHILSRFRRMFPHAVSFNMDIGTIRRHQNLCIKWKGLVQDEPERLTDAELQAYRFCCENRLRLEQERIRFSDLVKQF